MGGRGQNRSRGNTNGNGATGKINSLPLAGQTKFYDGTKTDTEITVRAWEDKHNDLTHEQLLMVNQDGYAVAYFDGDKQSVAFQIPKGVNPKDITLTHVHPAAYDRTIGGGFSDADIENHIAFKFKETRATSVEGNYSFRTTSESDPKGFLKALKTRKQTVMQSYNDALQSINKQGVSLSSKEETDLYLRISDIWYQHTASKFGYEYHSPYSDDKERR